MYVLYKWWNQKVENSSFFYIMRKCMYDTSDDDNDDYSDNEDDNKNIFLHTWFLRLWVN